MSGVFGILSNRYTIVLRQLTMQALINLAAEKNVLCAQSLIAQFAGCPVKEERRLKKRT